MWSFWLAAGIAFIGGLWPLVFGGTSSRVAMAVIPFTVGAAALAACGFFYRQGRAITAVIYFVGGLALVYGLLSMLAVPLEIAVLGSCPAPPAPCAPGVDGRVPEAAASSPDAADGEKDPPAHGGLTGSGGQAGCGDSLRGPDEQRRRARRACPRRAASARRGGASRAAAPRVESAYDLEPRRETSARYSAIQAAQIRVKRRAADRAHPLMRERAAEELSPKMSCMGAEDPPRCSSARL